MKIKILSQDRQTSGLCRGKLECLSSVWRYEVKILLLSDPPLLKNNSYYTSLAIPLINGYFADNKNITIKHLFITDEGAIEEDIELEEFDLIGYSCLLPYKIFLLLPFIKNVKEKFYIGGSGFHIVKDVLNEMNINYFEGFGEWLIEDKLNIPRNPDIFSEQKILFTDRLLSFFEEKKIHSDYSILLLITNGYGCSWNKCNFCQFNLSTIANHIYHKDFVFKSYENLKEISLSLKEQLRNYKTFAWLTSFDMPAKILEQTSETMNGIFSWFCFLRPRKYPEGLFKKIKEMGFLGANIGVEVAHDEGLKMLNKGITMEEIEWTLKELFKANLMIIEAGYITHIPEFYKLDEAIENFKKYVLPYIKSIELLPLAIVKGSRFYDQRLEQGQKPIDCQMSLNLDDKLNELNNEYRKKIISLVQGYNVQVI